MTAKDRAIVTGWRGRLVRRRALELASKRRHRGLSKQLAAAVAAGRPALALTADRNAEGVTLRKRRRQVASARRVIARRIAAGANVAAPVEPILGDSWGWHPGTHDGIDVTGRFEDEVVAMADGVIVDARPADWWGNSALPSSGHPVSDGDGIVQIQITRSVGPFKAGDIIGYGHCEKAVVRKGQKVRAGQTIAQVGWAVTGHIHLMHRGPMTARERASGRPAGVGTMNPRAILDYAVQGG